MSEPELKISNEPIDRWTINPQWTISEDLLNHIAAEVARILLKELESDFLDRLAAQVQSRLMSAASKKPEEARDE